MVKLGDICTKASSGIKQSDLQDRNGDYPIYGAGGLIKNVDFYEREKPYVAVVKDGAGAGRVMRLPAFSSVIGTMQYIIPNEGVDVRYLAYAMEFMDLSRYCMGATIPHIYFKDYCAEELPKHSEREQNRIAYTLEKIDGLLGLRRRQLAKLDELVESQFVEWFGFPENNVKGYPIGKIGDIVSDVHYGTSAKASETGKYTYIRMNNITYEGTLDLTDVKRITIEEREVENFIVRQGDVLFNRTNSRELVGKTCVFNRQEPMVIAGYIIRLRMNGVILPEYLSAFLNTHYAKKLLRGMAKGAVGQANINAKELQDIAIIIPPMEEQNRFLSLVRQSDKSKLAIRDSLDKLETLKSALMQQYFG